MNPTCCKPKAQGLLFPTPDGLPQTNAPAWELTRLVHTQSPADSHFRTGGGLVTKLCQTLVAPWMAAHQDPLSRRLSWQKYWRGLPFPPPGDPHDPGIELRSPALQVYSFTPLALKNYLQAIQISLIIWHPVFLK